MGDAVMGDDDALLRNGDALWESIRRRLAETQAVVERLHVLRGIDAPYRADVLLGGSADLADALVAFDAGKLGLDAVREACADVCLECAVLYLAACLDELDRGGMTT